MDSGKGGELHMLLFPFMIHGHLIPMVDMAKLFASRGVKITVVTTPLSATFISKSIPKTKSLDIQLLVLKFPCTEIGLPDVCENADSIPTADLLPKLFASTGLLQAPLEQALLENRPHCLLADMFFPWTNDVAAKFGIPRLIFHGTSFFSLSTSHFMRLHKPHNHVSSETEPFLIPFLPGGDIKLTKLQLSEILRENVQSDLAKFITRVEESESECYGVVVNSFYELEAEYADCYRNFFGRKAWQIGPLSLRNKKTQEEVQKRGLWAL